MDSVSLTFKKILFAQKVTKELFFERSHSLDKPAKVKRQPRLPALQTKVVCHALQGKRVDDGGPRGIAAEGPPARKHGVAGGWLFVTSWHEAWE